MAGDLSIHDVARASGIAIHDDNDNSEMLDPGAGQDSTFDLAGLSFLFLSGIHAN